MPIRTGKGAETAREMPTNLTESDLRFANLSGTNFTGANLSKADLRSVNRMKTIFTDATLENVMVTK